MIAWKENHKGGCKLNHNGSAPAMEQKHFFERAARYTEYYPKYKTCKEVVKFECVGHYQQKVGTLLRKLKKDKGLSELTAPLIDKLQNYFGIAL